MIRDDGRVLEKRLAQLRQRLRRLYLGFGAATLLIIIGFTALISFGADYLLDLPRGVRLVLLATTVATLVFLTIRRLVYPLRRPLTDDDLALLLENAHPELQARLISAIQLSRHADDRSWNESRALIDSVVAEGRQLAEGLDLRRVVDPKPVQRRAGVATVLILSAAGVLAANAELAGIWWQRFLGSEIRWPQKTFLRLVLPTDDPAIFVDEADGETRIRVARGGSLPVKVEVEGTIPETVELVQQLIALESDGERIGLDRRIPMQRRGEREFQIRFRDLIDSFYFHIEGGDDNDADPRVRVDVIMPPEIDQIQVDYLFPAYTGLPNKTEYQGNIDAPIGTIVTITARTTLPLEQATFLIDGQDVGNMELVEDRLVRRQLEVIGTAQYSFQLQGQNQLRNQKPGVYAIRAIKDQKPSLRLYSPSRVQIDATPSAVVPIRALIQDDYGIAGVSLRYRLSGAEADQEYSLVPPQLVGETGSSRLAAYYPLEIGQLQLPDEAGVARPLAEGDTLEYFLVASDFQATSAGDPIPNEGETQRYHVDVVSPGELIRRINERQVRLKEMTRSLRGLQQETYQEFEALRGLFADGSELQPADQSRAVRIEIDQNRVTNDALALSQELAGLFQTYLFNRLEPGYQIDKLIGLVDELAREGGYLESYEPELFSEVVAIYASGQLGELEMTGKVLGLVQLAQDVATQLSPDAYQALARGRKSPEASAMSEEFNLAADRQKAVLATLETLLTKMEEWEDYQEVLQLTRELLDLQRQLNERTIQELNK